MSNGIDFGKLEGIIFDIGNVIVDIDYQRVIERFQTVAKTDIHKIVSYQQQTLFFDTYEKGEISTAQFIAKLKTYLQDSVTDEQIIAIWNYMLVAFPKEKISLLQRLKSKFCLMALSNINELHVAEINKNVRELYGINAFKDLFHHAFYSNEVGFRKPEKELYEYVLNNVRISPEKLLFIDDKKENLLPAKALGILTLHLQHPNDLYAVFSAYQANI